MARVIVSNEGQRVVVAAEDRNTVVRQNLQRAAVATAAGPQGPRGPAGSSAGVNPPINFSFGDASPTPVLTLPAASEVAGIQLQIEQAFDGAGAAIRLGIAGQPGLLLDTWQNDPTSVGIYEVTPRVELPAGTALILTITPGAGASAGSGQFLINTIPTN
jgi:hypothetical protein